MHRIACASPISAAYGPDVAACILLSLQTCMYARKVGLVNEPGTGQCIDPG